MKRKSLLLLTLLAMLLAPFAANAQSTYSWGSVSDNGGSSQYANPFGRYYGWEYRVFLYPANTMNFNGRITQLEFLADDDLEAGGEIDIWMKETTLTDLDSDVTFAQYQANATLVYHSASSPAFSQDTYVAIPLQTPFMHDQSKNILILVRSVANGDTGDGQYSFYKKNPGSSGYLTWLGCNDSEAPDPSDNGSFDYIDVTNEDLPVIRWTYGSTPSGCDFYEDFESITNPSSGHSTAGPLPDGWDYIYTGSEATRPHVQNATSYPGLPSTGNYLAFNAGTASGYATDAYAILPAFANQMAPSHISFKARFESASNGTLKYGVIDSNNAFTELGTVSRSNTSPVTVDVDLNTSQTLGKRFAFHWHMGSSWYTAGVDDICVELTRVESVPTNLAASNITPNSADITWNGDSDSYTVWANTGTETQTLLSQGFEGGSLPSGWTTTSTGSNNWSVMTSVCSGVSPHGGSYAAGTPQGTSSRSEEMYLITPAMNMTNAITATLHFFYYQKAWGSDVCPFGVYYRIGTSGTWQELFYSTTGTSAWTEKTIALPEAACTTNCQIGFYRKDNYGYGAAIDDVTVSALMPVAEEITVIAPPYSLTGLHPNTTYTVKVKGENTAYCTPITFTTAQCTLTLASSPTAAGTSTAEPVGPFNEGDEVTLTATPAEGYMFKNWTKTGTGATFSNASDNPTTLTIGTANVTATANFVRAIQAGTQQSTSSYYPSQMNYRYSLTQQIYYPEEIGHTGTINCISFYCTSNGTQTRNIEIYLSKEGPASFDNSNKAFWKQMGTKVFDGTYTFKQGWNTIPLSTTFSYDNIDRNLMLTVYDKSGDYNGSLDFATFSHSNYCAQYKYSDDTEVGPTYLTTLPTPSSVGKYKNIVRFGMTDSSVKNCYTVTAVANPTSAGHIEEMLIGTGTQTSNTIPFSTASNYSFTEQIYYAGSMGGAGTINSISFYLGSSNSSAQTNDIVVYMKNVRRGGFKDGTDYEPVTSSNIVYNGQWTIPASYTGWVTIDLSTPFTYDGTSNLLIAIDENTSGNSGRSFRYTSVSNTVYRAYGSDDVDPTALDSYSGTKAVSSYCPNIKLGIAYNNSGSSRMYANGASCTVNAEAVAPTSSNFYVMAGWTENNETVSHSIPYTFTVNADHDLTATFEEWNVTLSTTPDPAECLEQGTDVTLVASTNLPMTGDYMFTATTATFSSISGSPDGSTTTTGDGTTMDVTLPFDFNLAGKDFAAGTILKMRCDGFVAFGSAWGTHSPSGPGTTHDVISVFGYDQYLTSTSAMYYKVTGTEGSRVLTMEWKNMRSYYSSYNYANYQVKMYEGSNAVELCYGDYTHGSTQTVYIYVSANGKMTQLSSITSPAVTTNVAGTTTGISVSSASAAPASGTVYRFSAPVTYTWTANGTTGTASDNVYTVTPTQNSTYTVTATHANGCIKTANISVTFAPAAPTNLQVSNIGVTTATATWDANGESNWEYSYDGSNWGTIHTNSVDLVDLTPGTTYTFQVRSYSGNCDSETISVEFTTENTHTVSVTAGIGGNASGSGTYNHGASCTVTATPSTENGYHFVNWTENGTEVSTEASYTFTVLADRDLVANFALDTHTVTISANPTDGGTVSQSGSGTYNYSDGCIVTASPATGWTFVNWTEDGSEVSTEASYTFAVHGNRTLVANFVYTFTKDITGHQGGNGNWYLLTSPLDGTIAPTDVTNMVATPAENYDLFYFKQDAPVDPETGEGLEWINYKETAENGGGFGLEAGKGYLYANHDDVQLQFTGVPYSGDGTVTLTNIAGFNWSGWNLVGNPYNENAQADVRFYAMNSSGTDIVAAQGYGIGPLEGIFVQYGDYTEVNFSPTGNSKKSASLALNVTQGRGLVDRAIVDFENGGTLAKFQLNPNHTKVYIPKDDKDYAVVMAESDMGEMPVNFKAEKNGTYTISVNAEDVAFGYLHLIDNLTGADVDLLANPSYSFNATTTDYASRFRLVFATANSDDDNFGFYNGSAWVINNDGEAVLQVVDVMGRILKSESISGCATVNIDAAPGVYMLRLINGDNERVQKVVVR